MNIVDAHTHPDNNGSGWATIFYECFAVVYQNEYKDKRAMSTPNKKMLGL